MPKPGGKPYYLHVGKLTVRQARVKGGKARARALSAERLSEIGRAGAEALNASLTAAQRSESARRAVLARWAKSA